MVDRERQLLTNDRLTSVVGKLQSVVQNGTNLRILIQTLKGAMQVMIISYKPFIYSLVHRS